MSRLTAMIAMFLIAVAMLVQAGSPGVQRAAAAAVVCTGLCDVDDSGNWSTPADWSPLAVPGPADDVCIDRTAADVTVTIDVPAVINSLAPTGNIAPASSRSPELADVLRDSGELAASAAPALPLSPPTNDDFAGATLLGADVGSLLAETNVDATAEAGEPSHDGLTSTPTHSVWYRWTPTVGGTAVFQITVPLVPNDWDMVLAAYTGSAVDALIEVAATSTFAYSVALQFEVVAGTTYHVAVDGRNSDQYGSFDLTWVTHLAPLNDNFASATLLGADRGSLIGETNAWATAEPGEPNHDGLAGIPAHSVWYQWTPSVDAAASFVMTTPVSPDDWDSVLAVYTGTAVGALTEVAANRTVGTYLPLDFSVTGGTTYHLAVDGQAADQMGAFDLSWSIWPDDGHFIVTKTEDTDDGACDADCSLREAVIAANSTPGDDVIDLPAATYLLTIKGSPSVNPAYGDLDIEREQGTTTILGSGRDVTVIDASGLRSEPVPSPDRVFTVHYHAGLELVGVTVTGGYTENALSADRDGGGIWNGNGTLTVTDCLIEGNVAGGNGGGIANSYGTATISNTIIRDNNTDPPDYTTTGYGGGIYNTGTMTIFDSTIELNASDYGGGIANEEWLEDYPATLDIENSVITNNTAERGGGLANVFLGTATVTDSLFTGNHATRNWDVGLNTYNRGGGILNWAADLTIIRSTITGNEARATHAIHPASGGGGGIANDVGDLTVIDSTVSGNEAICDQKLPGDPDLCGRGGGIVNAGGYATIVNSTISGNTTALLNSDHSPYLGGGGGGGFAHMPQLSGTTIYCPVTVLDSVTITDNTGAHGGGINTRWETRVGLLYYVEEWRVGTNANGRPILECLDLYVRNTIVAENTATFTIGTEDCRGGYTSADHNLVGDATGCPADGPGDVTTLDARLGPLADNGG
ncbi:MAG: CSLREA domain-containing protein, partial [Anaerolineae bacterium]|nr:CSLREA domain-containing protein [Anaerolineae bacterium]